MSAIALEEVTRRFEERIRLGTVVDECVAALRAVGAAVDDDGDALWVKTPSGALRSIERWRFVLLCATVHERTEHQCALKAA